MGTYPVEGLMAMSQKLEKKLLHFRGWSGEFLPSDVMTPSRDHLDAEGAGAFFFGWMDGGLHGCVR